MTAADMRTLHVLVVEDDLMARNLMTAILEEVETGRISFARNGHDALRILKRPSRKVDVILLDLAMPGMNGFEFIEKLRNECGPPLSRTPVVVVSGLSEKKSLDRAHDLGVDLFLLKPITKEQVLMRISAAVR